MRRALAIIASIAMVCAAAYLTLLNHTPAEFRFTPTYQVAADVGTLVVFAFVAWRSGRRQHWSERIDDWEERGEQLVWEGRAREGRALLYKAWRRRPENT